MSSLRPARAIAIVAVLLTLPVLVLRASTRAPAELNFVDRAVLRISSPIEGAITAAVRWVGRGWSGYVDLVDARREGERLRAENARLAAEVERLKLDAHRGERLEKLLGLRAELPSETLSARVIGVEGSAYYRVARVRLDRGDQEVKPRMPVIVPAGVVGRVGRVFDRYCDVDLAVDPRSAIDVVLPRTGGRGVLKGVAGTNGYRARIDYLLRTDAVAEGDVVVTSGVGGVFPRGLPVGTVSRVTRHDAGLYQEAEVTPSVDFTRLDEVLVILAPPPPPDPDAGTKPPTEPHRGLGVPR